jgi:hypothetical protein
MEDTIGKEKNPPKKIRRAASGHCWVLFLSSADLHGLSFYIKFQHFKLTQTIMQKSRLL